MRRHARRNLPSRRAGITLIESVIAIAVTSFCGASLLVALGGAIRASGDTLNTAIAQGLAEQLMDEIAAARYPDGVSPRASGPTREDFNNLDDYDGWFAQPPTDRLGNAVGTEGNTWMGISVPRPAATRSHPAWLRNLSQDVQVERVVEDANGWRAVAQHTSHRRVRVRIVSVPPGGPPRILAELERIFTYVPPGP